MNDAAAALAVVLAAAGCDRPEPPAALPPSRIHEVQPPVGRMVVAGPVRGFLVRPRAPGPHPSVLLVVEALDDEARARAADLARSGSIVLAVDAGANLERARAYLAGVRGAAGPPRTCRGACTGAPGAGQNRQRQ